MVDWLGMFGSPFVQDVPPDRRDDLLERAAALLRPTLLRDGRWYVDYRRLRFQAVRT
jgi:hypothetical protein